MVVSATATPADKRSYRVIFATGQGMTVYAHTLVDAAQKTANLGRQVQVKEVTQLDDETVHGQFNLFDGGQHVRT